jgi:hypothetical protein
MNYLDENAKNALRSFKAKIQPYLDNYGDDPSCAFTLALPTGKVTITARDLYHVDNAIVTALKEMNDEIFMSALCKVSWQAVRLRHPNYPSDHLPEGTDKLTLEELERIESILMGFVPVEDLVSNEPY